MNPGSSQFASQFPDTEETMSKMESKKLPIIEGYTPMPWEVCEESDAFPGIEAPEMDFSVVVVGFEEDYDCGIQGRNREEQLANARLIAAAPDLYRIAHEQREVIRKLDAQVAELTDWVNADDFNPAVNHLLMRAREARAAAAPFLED